MYRKELKVPFCKQDLISGEVVWVLFCFFDKRPDDLVCVVPRIIDYFQLINSYINSIIGVTLYFATFCVLIFKCIEPAEHEVEAAKQDRTLLCL